MEALTVSWQCTSNSCLVLGVNALEHWRILQHVRDNHEADAAAAQENVVQMRYPAVLQPDSRNISKGLKMMQVLPVHAECRMHSELPTRSVAVTFFSWQFQLSSASCSSPRYVWPVFSSTCRVHKREKLQVVLRAAGMWCTVFQSERLAAPLRH